MRTLIAALIVLAAAPALAQTKTLGSFEKWSAFSLQEQGRPVCYLASQPADSKGGPPKRGEVFLMVTHRPATKANDVVSFGAGYELKSGSEAEAVVGGQVYKLFTRGDRAWAADEKMDKALVQALIKGATLVIRATPGQGSASTDSFSLAGFGKAHQAINQACGVK
jgi:invasion protein IalB